MKTVFTATHRSPCFLARRPCRNVQTSGAFLATSDGNLVPSPATAASFPAEKVNICAFAGDTTVHIVDSNLGDRNTSGGLASWAAIQVVLLDNNTVL